jgi:Phage lysis protein, holin.
MKYPTDKASIARIVALVASILAYFGMNFPEDTQEYVVGAVMLVLTIYAAWKNNYLSSKGKKQQKVLKDNKLD